MAELIEAVVSLSSLLLVLVVFGFAPGFCLRLIVLAYPHDDPRRAELIAELYTVPRIQRPLWVTEQLEVALFEGLAHRVSATLRRLTNRRRARGSISGWLTLRGLQPGLDLDRVARDLARAVRVQRQRFVDQALAVAWTARPARIGFRDPQAADLAGLVETLLLQWQDTAGAEAGTIEDVAAFYRQQPGGRLVVLGAPGAGKTVLLSRLVLDLLDEIEASATTGDLPPRTPIPVLLSLPSCDLGDPQGLSSDQLADRLQEWITHRLVKDYHLRRAEAVALVRARRVLLVLDGLDEMDPAPPEGTTGTADRPRARTVLQALNVPDRPPVVLACRQLDYHHISQTTTDHTGHVAILTDARHVMLRPLDATDIVSYLTERFHGRDRHLRPRWQPVADALRAGAPLLPVLANPWQLILAVTAYTAENSDPAELLTMSPVQVEAHLLANL